jgi:hypothetical protein
MYTIKKIIDINIAAEVWSIVLNDGYIIYIIHRVIDFFSNKAHRYMPILTGVLQFYNVPNIIYTLE